ncbi:PREDICTED: protein POOR HOMOLOGOUS SYNAPSIS 1 isoform X2 [Lupinus angustifolius]|uniref:protein POOR HOMOLOGOUS SYNAPSIS 1 isoform X2 n=1 Tax=Lupinus angustifolius TaxID=3871 RepID=UPI00092F38DB|nr:PREDICTED: protein POOR HOMOLOGOUS SYNAPSIS 1 isoform X2 [Lupinus angustifolius]
MAGTLAMIPTNSPTTIRDQWEICYARFIPYSATATTTTATTSSDLIPIPPRIRNHPPRGNWISSSSVAFLRLLTDYSSDDVILTVSFNSKLLEEHYVSKLYFSWPQVSCISGFPARGIRTVLVSYRDSLGEIQKFAMRFPTIYETESFINSLKEIVKDEKSPCRTGVHSPEPLNTDFGSAISAQSEFMSSNNHSHRACEEPSFMTPVGSYIPQMPQSINGRRVTPSGTQEKATTPSQNFEGVLPALPPSFTSLLMDCSEINHAQPTVSKEVDLKSQIMRYMEDSSFQDMLIKVEKVICEMGGDLSL